MKNLLSYLLKMYLLSLITPSLAAETLPQGFVYLKDVAPTIWQDIRYATNDNFVGKPLPGYENPVCILTKPAADALLQVQRTLNQQGLGLKVFDGYRPPMTVDAFILWSKDPYDQKMKQDYYPHVDKALFFTLGYVAEKSGHTRGSTVDLTIIDLRTGQELDMGTHFDFMDELSHPFNQAVTQEQYQNRQLLNSVMSQNGFMPLNEQDTEWWHFTLKNELYPDTYFNFPIKVPL